MVLRVCFVVECFLCFSPFPCFIHSRPIEKRLWCLRKGPSINGTWLQIVQKTRHALHWTKTQCPWLGSTGGRRRARCQKSHWKGETSSTTSQPSTTRPDTKATAAACSDDDETILPTRASPKIISRANSAEGSRLLSQCNHVTRGVPQVIPWSTKAVGCVGGIRCTGGVCILNQGCHATSTGVCPLHIAENARVNIHTRTFWNCTVLRFIILYSAVSIFQRLPLGSHVLSIAA